MQLTFEDHGKLRTKQVANIICKLNGGKTLTAREEAILANARVEDFETPRAAAGYVGTGMSSPSSWELRLTGFAIAG